MRRSGIELLRILSLFAVIMIHYWEQAAPYAEGLNYHSLVLLRSLSASAVDIFIIISGYFLCTTDKRTLGKPLNLVIQVSLINEAAYLIKSYFGLEPPLSLRHIASSLLPDSYYTTLFVVLYLLSPYINKVISQLTLKGWNKLLLLFVSIFSIYQTAYDVFSEVLGKEIMGLSTIGAWGGQKGFNIVNFVLLYIIGAYLRINAINIKRRQILLLIIICVSFIFLWAEMDLIFKTSTPYSAWLYHNPLVILMGVLFFLYFKELSFSSKGINMVAKSVYTCFLAHCQVITVLDIKRYAQSSLWQMLFNYLVLSFLFLIIFWFLWYLYDKVTNGIYKKIDQKEICYCI